MAVNDDSGSYCREVEAYLCRKNGGHLVRIVGPAFEQVCGWAARGIPIKIVFRGIDRYVDRYHAKGPRRRPARVEFCEADVLDVFDEWRRAVGVGSVAPAEGESANEGAVARKRSSLPAHLDRVVARLTVLRAGEARSLEATLDGIIRELDAVRASSKGLRGEARETLLARLRAIDLRLLEAARTACDAPTLQRLSVDADIQLAPFLARMAPGVYAQSKQACVDRLVREHLRLPTVTFD